MSRSENLNKQAFGDDCSLHLVFRISRSDKEKVNGLTKEYFCQRDKMKKRREGEMGETSAEFRSKEQKGSSCES